MITANIPAQSGALCSGCGVDGVLRLPCSHSFCEWCFVEMVRRSGAATCRCGAITLRAATVCAARRHDPIEWAKSG